MGVLRSNRFSRLLAGWTVAILLCLCAVPQDAGAAVLQQVQSGTAVNSANGIQTVTISSIDITKSFLVFQVRSTGDRPVNTTLRGRLASSTTIEFERLTNEGAPLAINIQWYVATFGSGVLVQRGTATMSMLTVNVGVTAVASMSQAFVLWSMTPLAAEIEHGSDDVITGDLTTTSNLEFRTNDPSGHIVWWQVVEFTDPADINVQRGTVSTMTGATLSANATLGTAVDVSRTFVLAGLRTVGLGPDIGARMLRARLTGPTTIAFDRGIAGSPDDMNAISWQAVELKDGSTVQRGSASFANGVAQATAPLVPRVNTTRAIAFASVQAGGQSMGRTPYSANDATGVASITAALSPTQLTLDRSLTAATADVGWFVVQFAGGDGFKVGSFTKAPGVAPTPQTIAHGLGEVPKALILWTQGRSDETFSSAAGITLRGASTGTAATGVLTLTINVPPGTAANDGMVASVAVRPNTAVITPPAGWALVQRMDNATAQASSLAIYGRIATTGEPASYAWTLDTSTGSAGGIQSFTGMDVTNPFDTAFGASTASSLNHTAPSITTTSANDMIVTFHAFPSGATWTPPAGMTEAFDVSSTPVPNGAGMSVVGSYAVQAAVGATGTKTATASNDADPGNAFTGAMRAAPAGTAYFGFGMTDGTTSRSVSTSSQDGVGTSNASTRMANKVLTMVRWGEVVVAEADLSSWNDTTFTLNWTTNDLAGYVIHYIAIGGSDVSAKVVDWTMRTTTGNQTVTGVGFDPDVVFHAHGGHALTAALPTNLAGGAFGLGVMDFDGDQWAFANWTVDNVGTSDTQRGQLTNAAIYSFTNGLIVQKQASWVSMNADGFTLNFTNTGSALAARVFSLALKGVNVKPGSFLKATAAAPATQAITGVGFRPNLVMLASVQSTTQANPVAHSRFGLGASDGTSEGSSAFQDEDAVDVTVVEAIDKTSKVFVKVDNSTPVINAEADLTALGTDGFTLNWTTNDAVQTRDPVPEHGAACRHRGAPHLLHRVARSARRAPGVADRLRSRQPRLPSVSRDRRPSHAHHEVARRRVRPDGRLETPRDERAEVQLLGSRQERCLAAGDVLARGRGLQREEHVARSRAAGGSRWPARKSCRQQPDARAVWAVAWDTARNASSRRPSRGWQRLAAAVAVRSSRMAVVAPATTPADARQAQWAIASQLGVKIGVRVAGWYRVPQPTLVAAGLDPNVDPTTLRLYLEGIEQPILVTGADGRTLRSG